MSNLTRAITEEQYNKRLQDIKDNLAKDVWGGKIDSLDDTLLYLKNAVTNLKRLKNKSFLSKHSLVKNSVTYSCFSLMEREYIAFMGDKGKTIEGQFTIEKLSKIPLSRIKAIKSVTAANIKAAKEVVKFVGLSFPVE